MDDGGGNAVTARWSRAGGDGEDEVFVCGGASLAVRHCLPERLAPPESVSLARTDIPTRTGYTRCHQREESFGESPFIELDADWIQVMDADWLHSLIHLSLYSMQTIIMT